MRLLVLLRLSRTAVLSLWLCLDVVMVTYPFLNAYRSPSHWWLSKYHVVISSVWSSSIVQFQPPILQITDLSLSTLFWPVSTLFHCGEMSPSPQEQLRVQFLGQRHFVLISEGARDRTNVPFASWPPLPTEPFHTHTTHWCSYVMVAVCIISNATCRSAREDANLVANHLLFNSQVASKHWILVFVLEDF